LEAQQSSCEELFISEFLEGDLLNKAIEIYNPKEESVDLSGYTLSVFANGSTEATFIHELTGQLESHETYVVCNAGSLQPVLDIANATSDVCSFNGNDAVVLAYNDLALDIIGIVGEDPLGTWIVGTGSTENYTLVRKSNVQVPTTNWSESESQWDVYPEDTVSEIGEHTSECAGPVGVLENNEQKLVAVYPNPCSNYLIVESQIEGNEVSIQLKDVRSNLVLESIILKENGKVKIDTSRLISGLYVLETLNGGEIQRTTVVVGR
jgi:hypothetical protein